VREPLSKSKDSKLKANLVSVASELFCKKGIHATGIDKLIKLADIAKASFYTNFPSKDDLIVACLRESERQLAELVNSGRDAGGAPLANWLRALELWLSKSGHRSLHLIALIEFPDSGHSVQVEVRESRDRLINQIAEILRGENFEDPESVAQKILLTIDGAQIAALHGKPVESIWVAAQNLLNQTREIEPAIKPSMTLINEIPATAVAAAPPLQTFEKVETRYCTLCGRILYKPAAKYRCEMREDTCTLELGWP
jgi:AcrR family transcriptional regulator